MNYRATPISDQHLLKISGAESVFIVFGGNIEILMSLETEYIILFFLVNFALLSTYIRLRQN